MNKINHWMADQVVYEIFPDRFAIGQPNTSESKRKLPSYQREAFYETRDWLRELPVKPSLGWDFFCGDLQGIIDHIGHLEELGVTALFLTPIFLSTSNHKYDTEDFYTIDEQFGDENTLRKLIQELHHCGMRLFMDAVFNHVRNTHRWFLDAQKGKQPYRDFFKFRPDGSYERWQDYQHMPELNLSNQELKDKLYQNPDSVLQKYLSMGLDGWRFDAAIDLGLDMVRSIRRVIEERFPDAAMIGEVTNFAGEWTNGEDKYHGVMNYYFRTAVLEWLRGNISVRHMSSAVKEYYDGYGFEGALCSWNILSSHDTPRLKTMLPKPDQRKLAIIAQFTLPGVPFVYYGEEIGMDGADDPDCRRPMVWDELLWDRDTLDFYKKIIKIRQSRVELRHGRFSLLEQRLEGDAIAFLRYTDIPNEVSLVIINNSEHVIEQRLLIPHSHLYHNLWLENLLRPEDKALSMGQGYLDLNVSPMSGVIYVPNDTQFSNYRFFKYLKKP